MKKLITIILLAVALLPQANYAQPLTPKGAFVPGIFVNPKTGERKTIFTKSTALIIANHDYTNGKKNLNGWRDLDSVKTEYRRLADSLFRLGFDTIIRLNLTKDQMETTMKWFINNYGYDREARILIYYSGHGNVTMERGKERGYTVPVGAPLFKPNADFDKLEDYTRYERDRRIDYKLVEEYKKKQDAFVKQAINYDQWYLWAKDLEMNTKHVLFLFDCCFAGQILYAGKNDQLSVEIEKAVSNQAVEFITASDRYQTAPGESTFLKYFLLAVSGKAPAADANGDDYLKSSELFDYLNVNVNRAVGDNPRRGGLPQEFDKQGEFVFVLPGAGKNPPPNEIAKPNETKIPGETGSNQPPTNTKLTIIKSAYISDMVFVKGGTFTMGSADGEANEKPPHQVTVSDYYITIKEITQKQWRDIMGTNPSYFKDCDDCPVEQVSWLDVQEFINKLNEKTNKTYRLPTEAEWEYAARGGKYSKGNEYSGGNMIVDVAWCSDNSISKTHPVGKKKPNELGIFDMSGNVWEWCYDYFDASFYANNKKTKDPCNTITTAGRVVRGGSWGNSPYYCRVAYRYYGTPDYRDGNVGFRLVLVP